MIYRNNILNSGSDINCDYNNKKNSNSDHDKGNNEEQDESSMFVNHKIMEYSGFC